MNRRREQSIHPPSGTPNPSGDLAAAAIDAILDVHGVTIEAYLESKGLSRPKAELPGLLPEPEAREFLGGISRTTLYRLVKDGQIDAVRIGRRLFFAPRDLETFIRSQRSGRPSKKRS